MDTIEFIKEVNSRRLSGGWYGFNGVVNNKEVIIKGYKTWLQIFKVNGYSIPSGYDLKVSEFKEVLTKGVQ